MDFDVLNTVMSALSALAAATASLFAIRLYHARTQVEAISTAIQQEQAKVLNSMSDFGARLMTHTLRVSPQYAFAPYQGMLPAVSPDDLSLFDRRRSHFTPEKDRLADKIVEIIKDRIEKHDDVTVLLILDAGSTVYPVFRKLCECPTFKFDRAKAKRLKIITNNLPGVSELIKCGLVGDPINATTLFECRVLMGFANSKYEASLSEKTADDLATAIGELSERITTSTVEKVSVITGNYVSLEDGVLARDEHHLKTKNEMLAVSTCTYIVAPLGKIVRDDAKTFNDLLGLGAKDGYGKLSSFDKGKEDKIKYVVTTRKESYFPKLGPRMCAALGNVQSELIQLHKNSLVPVEFSPLEEATVRIQQQILGDQEALERYEVPHKNLREALNRIGQQPWEASA